MAGALYDAAVGDVNGDGKADIVAAGDTSLVVKLGKGDGTFGPATSFSDPDYPKTVTLADFNGDGKLDALTTSYLTGLAKLWTNTGNGTFKQHEHAARRCRRVRRCRRGFQRRRPDRHRHREGARAAAR